MLTCHYFPLNTCSCANQELATFEKLFRENAKASDDKMVMDLKDLYSFLNVSY